MFQVTSEFGPNLYRGFAVAFRVVLVTKQSSGQTFRTRGAFCFLFEFGGIALQIALIHLLFNIFGILVVYGIPFMREIPIWGAKKLADAAAKQKLYAVAYLVGLSFLLLICTLTIGQYMGY